MTPAPVSIINFEALKKSASALSKRLSWPRECTPRPLRGATRPYVPAGTATDIWVSTRPFPRAGIVMSTALFAFYSLLYIKSVYYTYLYRSYPADNEEPLVGNLAFSDNRLIKSLVGAVVSVSSPEDTFLFLVWESDIEVRRKNASVHIQPLVAFGSKTHVFCVQTYRKSFTACRDYCSKVWSRRKTSTAESVNMIAQMSHSDVVQRLGIFTCKYDSYRYIVNMI